jgi:hypothetical protein
MGDWCDRDEIRIVVGLSGVLIDVTFVVIGDDMCRGIWGFIYILDSRGSKLIC